VQARTVSFVGVGWQSQDIFSPNRLRAMLGRHPDLVQDGRTMIGYVAPATAAHVRSRFSPRTWLAVGLVDRSDLCPGTYRSTGCYPIRNGVGIGNYPCGKRGRLGRLVPCASAAVLLFHQMMKMRAGRAVADAPYGHRPLVPVDGGAALRLKHRPTRRSSDCRAALDSKQYSARWLPKVVGC